MSKEVGENQLIANFMGLRVKVNQRGYLITIPDEEDNSFDYVQYHTSWDWLMPVVQKILNREQTFPDSYTLWVSDSLQSANISTVYNAVIQFIQWYNENQPI